MTESNAEACDVAQAGCRRLQDENLRAARAGVGARQDDMARGMLTGLSMETTQTTTSDAPRFTGCCPRFDPASFQDACFEWRDEPFVKAHVTSLFHVPLNMGKQVTRANALIEAESAQPSVPLMLSDEDSPWGADLYIHVTKTVPDAQMAALSGTYLTKVFEGPFRDAPKWAEQMRAYVASQGKTLEKLYFGYPTCPACAKAYGKNYVVLFARVAA